MEAEYKSPEHGSTLVTVNSKKELAFVAEWSRENGKHFGIIGQEKYPIYIATKDGGWTDRNDRAAYYITFKEFLSKIGY